MVDLPQVQGLTQQDREFTPTEIPVSMALKMCSATHQPDGPGCLMQQSIKPWKNAKAGFHCTFNLLKDVNGVCAKMLC